MRQLARGVGLLQEINFFLGKVQGGFHQHAQVNQRIAQGVDFLRKSARQGATCTADRCLGAGIDQVGNGLCLRQIDLVIQKSPLRKLTRQRHPQTRKTRRRLDRTERRTGFEAAGQQQLQHHRPAVGL